ncbi:hypothetical protein [Calothrix sp. CCY 0018]
MVSHLLDLMEENPEEDEETKENIELISEAEKEFKAGRMLFLL